MKKLAIRSLVLLAWSMNLASCTSDDVRENNSVTPDAKGLILVEIRSGINGGRTELNNDGKTVVFQANDSLAVWDGQGDGKIRRFGTKDGGSVAIFKGSLDENARNLNILYPLQDGATCNSGTITATIPATQKATAGTFDPRANLSVATADYVKGQNVTCTLENVCGVLKFTISDDAAEEYYDYIQLIGIANKDLTDLAGTVKISASEQKITEMTAGEKMITLTKKDDDNKLQKGKTYCIVMNPQASIDSLRMKFFKGTEEVGMATITKADKSQFSISSGVILNAGTITPKTVRGFTINSMWDRVVFAPGNLYYDKTPDDGVTYWNFEKNQYNYRTFSAKDGTPADTYGLFGWGDVPANGANIKTSQTPTDYQWTEWGTKIGDGKTWRTLTQAEWAYVRNTRSDVNRFAKARVHDVNGLLLFSDGYNGDTVVTGIDGIAQVNNEDVGYPNTNISDDNWTKLDAIGCIFLPCAGYGWSASAREVGTNGTYWSSTPSIDTQAFSLDFFPTEVSMVSHWRYHTHAVRLVKNAPVTIPVSLTGGISSGSFSSN